MNKWIVAPYGNAVVNGEPESEWDWMVMREDDTESIEVESKARAEQIATFLNAADLNSARQRGLAAMDAAHAAFSTATDVEITETVTNAIKEARQQNPDTDDH